MIPHIDERKRLVELRKQEEALEREEQEALAPLKAEAARHTDPLTAEYDAWRSGGDVVAQLRRLEELRGKVAPFQIPIEEARKPFTLRAEKLREEIDSIEEITGCLREDEENGGYLTCGITGLPILESDEVWRVIAAAVPKASP